MIQSLFKSASAPGLVKLKINMAPKPTDLVYLVLSTKELSHVDEWLESMENRADFQSKLKKADKHVRVMDVHTELKDVQPGTYYCYLLKLIRGEKSEVDKECMQKKIRVVSNGASEVAFNVVNDEACVRIFVKDGDSFVTGADVSVEGFLNPFVSKGPKEIVVHLKVGQYAVTGFYNGKRAKHTLRVNNLDDQHIELTLR